MFYFQVITIAANHRYWWSLTYWCMIICSSVPMVSRWLWPGNRTFLEVASMVVTWCIAFFCAVHDTIWNRSYMIPFSYLLLEYSARWSGNFTGEVSLCTQNPDIKFSIYSIVSYIISPFVKINDTVTSDTPRTPPPPPPKAHTHSL